MLRPDREDDLLIPRVASGDRAALAELVTRHGRAVLRLARALAPGDAAEDVVQETFLAALRGAATFDPARGSARTWLFAIARNAARHTRRRAREVPNAEMDETPLGDLGVAAGWGAPDARLDREESASRLARAVASLGSDDREVLVLRDVEGLEGEETAALLGVGLAAMKSRLHRARLRLMARLREQEGGVVESEREIAGLTCGAVLERLGDYVDGELDAAEIARVDAHLRGCTVCERFGGRYAGVVHAARERLGAAHDVDDATFARVLEALAR